MVAIDSLVEHEVHVRSRLIFPVYAALEAELFVLIFIQKEIGPVELWTEAEPGLDRGESLLEVALGEADRMQFLFGSNAEVFRWPY